MPQLHHRDPGIIGLLGAAPGTLALGSSATSMSRQNSVGMSAYGEQYKAFTNATDSTAEPEQISDETNTAAYTSSGAEALNELDTPPKTPMFGAMRVPRRGPSLLGMDAFSLDGSTSNLVEGKETKVKERERPFYGIIVDGVHSHPNSVRVRFCCQLSDSPTSTSESMP